MSRTQWLEPHAYMMRHYGDSGPQLAGYWCISINLGKLNSLHIGVQNDYGFWQEVPFK